MQTYKKYPNLKLIHRVPAGALPSDNSIELFTDRETKRLYFMQCGVTKPFRELPPHYKMQIMAQLLSDVKAMQDLRVLPVSEALEAYAFCLYGAMDSTPDFCKEGKLAANENFMCSDNCRCVSWHTKTINYNGRAITGREIEVIRELRHDRKDLLTAYELGMAVPTLVTHKKHLFDKFDVHSTTALITKAIASKIIQ